MNIDFRFPTVIFSGVGCVKKNAGALVLGKRAVIVTGRMSAKASGALADVTAVLDGTGVEYAVFDRATENPPVAMCREGGAFCRDFGADFVIGIGGGSPLDASKATAAFAVLPGASEDDIFSAEAAAATPLPVAAIPTTAGTGSEANQYAVLTLTGGLLKKTFKTTHSYPKVAFVDPVYTYSLGRKSTISCALDAFSHALESYMSPKANAFTELFSLTGGKYIWHSLFGYSDADFTPERRELLIYGSTAAGIAISHCGTGFTHPMGYALTMSEGVPHGFACAAFTGEYVRYNMKSREGADKLARFAAYIGAEPEEIAEKIPAAADLDLRFDGDKKREYAMRNAKAGNFANSPYVLSEAEMLEIYEKLF